MLCCRWRCVHARMPAHACTLARRLQQRHREMLEGFEQQCREEPVKPKWSRTLLNMRVQEEHLIKQRRFPAAAKVGATGTGAGVPAAYGLDCC